MTGRKQLATQAHYADVEDEAVLVSVPDANLTVILVPRDALTRWFSSREKYEWQKVAQ